ncbi:hypothetical protein HK105_203817 [Polyrhizophydium stewartii]|uniref:Uncharacterized protein n=1 Tax=Polyrhizophydium stewartii TaxID=2732419 RepID=A0ABR4NB20_9FUNG
MAPLHAAADVRADVDRIGLPDLFVSDAGGADSLSMDLEAFRSTGAGLSASVFRWKLRTRGAQLAPTSLEPECALSPIPPPPQEPERDFGEPGPSADSVKGRPEPDSADVDVTLARVAQFLLVLVHCNGGCNESLDAVPPDVRRILAYTAAAAHQSQDIELLDVHGEDGKHAQSPGRATDSMSLDELVMQPAAPPELHPCEPSAGDSCVPPRVLQILRLSDLLLVATFPHDNFADILGVDPKSLLGHPQYFSRLLSDSDHARFHDTLQRSSPMSPIQHEQVCSHKSFTISYMVRSASDAYSSSPVSSFSFSDARGLSPAPCDSASCDMAPRDPTLPILETSIERVPYTSKSPMPSSVASPSSLSEGTAGRHVRIKSLVLFCHSLLFVLSEQCSAADKTSLAMPVPVKSSLAHSRALPRFPGSKTGTARRRTRNSHRDAEKDKQDVGGSGYIADKHSIGDTAAGGGAKAKQRIQHQLRSYGYGRSREHLRMRARTHSATGSIASISSSSGSVHSAESMGMAMDSPPQGDAQDLVLDQPQEMPAHAAGCDCHGAEPDCASQAPASSDAARIAASARSAVDHAAGSAVEGARDSASASSLPATACHAHGKSATCTQTYDPLSPPCPIMQAAIQLAFLHHVTSHHHLPHDPPQASAHHLAMMRWTSPLVADSTPARPFPPSGLPAAAAPAG